MSEHKKTALFGRRKGKPLRARQTALMRELLPQLEIDVSSPIEGDLRGLFSADVDAVWLEIGFGGGEHLIHRAGENPQVGCIGCEPFVNGMAKAVSRVAEQALDNVRLLNDDAGLLLDQLPEASVDLAYLLYPDPWPKKRHWKRRFVGPRNLDRLARALRPGAEFRFASDIESYVNWTLQHLHAHPAFEWRDAAAADWQTPWEGWPGTRYEAKAIREGRTPAYLTFRRI
ncbi:tRNA (guanine(46)-N(7))-methyltransferase TrmB [Breoghania sp. L-A4]|uniref:tRNA (guanine(46)-N(7))-methyltransferase TrmB n=1 Tax=Breoghania sp. L-A4 TaxID=2304600 RepID=UPI000E35A455|nr:tRNA (guanine(46)-N(7))-methyltransferase TrmB [Breoghania sp. L-A4]AXS39004.1 tRNA (guanosine(46)-N7)-methyltransferase TrmB [Breoghania sp. L-A4]